MYVCCGLQVLRGQDCGLIASTGRTKPMDKALMRSLAQGWLERLE